MKFSILIPVKQINAYIYETVSHIKKINNVEWELLILPNNAEDFPDFGEQIRVIPTGKVGPARKRDIGAAHSSGDILVFLDDDSFPDAEFLKKAKNYFLTSDVVAVGGPAITPQSNSFWQKVSGAVFLSKFSGGNPRRYLSIGESIEIDDWPSVNLMVRKTDFIDVGGFDTDFWPGEDTIICRKLNLITGKKLIYAPDVVVWHHRRAGFLQHLKQIGAYGLHRGYFIKKYPENSLKFIYFAPTFLVLFFILTLFNFYFFYVNFNLFLLGWFIYFVALMRAFKDIARIEGIAVAGCAILFIIPTHFYYGVSFARGLLEPSLESTLR